MSLRKLGIFLFIQYSIFNIQYSFGQVDTWTWISGSNVPYDVAIFGTQGIPSVNNHPPGLRSMEKWKDRQGNFWIYGGDGPLALSDLWKYDPLTNEWTWVKGDGAFDDPPVYGIKGISNPNNSPGYREQTLTWMDKSGAFWLFSGYNWVNDLWKYNIASNQWVWVSGDTIPSSKGVYGIQGVPGALNAPGGRYATYSAWTDSLNNLWLYGGDGYDVNGTFGQLDDLWKYDIANNEWTWMKGADSVNVPANYGTKRVFAANNDPGGRWTYTNWKDLKGNFWLIGGGLPPIGAALNDVWKYDVGLNEWTWMSGPDVLNNLGNYMANCVFDTLNLPQSRFDQSSSATDNCGEFWLFGGENNNYGGSNSLSDLWVFNPQQLKWNWINGTSAPDQPGNYGTMGVSSPSNIPCSRCFGAAWWGNDNKFYMFGGQQSKPNNYYADLWVFSPDTNCVPVCPAPLYPLLASFESNTTTLCANDCVNYTDYSSNATSWQWSFAGGSPSSSTDENPQVCYLASGIYNVSLIASNSAGSDTLIINNYITVDPAPPTPALTQEHDSIFCSTNPSYSRYQWYFDSTLISGATDTLLVFTQGGNYNVKVTNINGCSIAVGINIVGIKEFEVNDYFTLYPNPATDELLITTHWQSTTGQKKLTVFNVLGEIIYMHAFNSEQEIINCKPFSEGVYFVQVSDETQRAVLKFVKE